MTATDAGAVVRGPSRWFLLLFASLYAVQGVVVAYLFNYNKPYMHAHGLPVDRIGLVQSLALLPLALKFLVGPLSDRFNLLGRGHRLPYIALGLLIQSAGLVGLARVNPAERLPFFAFMAVLAVVGLAFYDTCCDGLVVDVTPPSGRARVQGILWASRFVAATVFTLGFGIWLGRLGGPRHADALLYASAALSAAPVGLVLVLREPPRAVDAERFTWSALRVMTRPWSLALLAFGTIYGVTGAAVESNLSLFYATVGLHSGPNLGALRASRNLGRAAGALALPVAVAWLPRARVLGLGLAGVALTVAFQASVSGLAAAGILGLAFGVAMGWNDTLFAALAMEGSDPRLAASTFALFMAVTNLSVMGDAVFSRGVAASGGYRTPFLVCAVLTLTALPFVVPLGRPSPQASHEREPASTL